MAKLFLIHSCEHDVTEYANWHVHLMDGLIEQDFFNERVEVTV